jgi:hypothetical protein
VRRLGKNEPLIAVCPELAFGSHFAMLSSDHAKEMITSTTWSSAQISPS